MREPWTVLNRGGQSATIADTGASLVRYQVAGVDVVEPIDLAQPPPAYDGAVLAPWPNRLADATWHLEGEPQLLPVTEVRTGSALHGLVWDTLWTPVESSADRVELGYDLAAREGYPFDLRLTTSYLLGDDGLVCELAATNAGEGVAPFGCGTHAFFGNEATRVDTMVLGLPADTWLEVDARLLPVERRPVQGSAFDLRTPRTLDGVVLDTAFTDVGADPDGRLRATLGFEACDVTIWADPDFGWWQIYTADSFPPDHPRWRRSVAIEPMTCPPDAFNSGDDVIWLGPGQTWRGTWGVTATRR